MKRTSAMLVVVLLFSLICGYGGYLLGKRATDMWYWSHAKEFVGYGYVGAVPNDGRIYCSKMVDGSTRVSWSERGNMCHASPIERIEPGY